MSLRAALVGLGYWGRNLSRALLNSNNFDLRFIVDLNRQSFENHVKFGREVQYSDKFESLPLEEVECVFIATPTSTHFELAKYFLERGKHVWLEKPATGSTVQANQLKILADSNKVKCFVDHTFLFSDSVKQIKNELVNLRFGKLLHIESNRSNLGRFQKDTSALYDLAIHDLAIIDFISERSEVESVSQHSFNPFDEKFPSISILTLKYQQGFGANIRVNWISPVKRRDFFIIGEKRSALYDETLGDHKLKYYNQEFFVDGDTSLSPESTRDFRISYRKGDIYIPQVENHEPLMVGIQEFAETIRFDLNHSCELKNVVRLLKVLECADLSAIQNGIFVKVTA